MILTDKALKEKKRASGPQSSARSLLRSVEQYVELCVGTSRVPDTGEIASPKPHLLYSPIFSDGWAGGIQYAQSLQSFTIAPADSIHAR